jgi:hypothetical protein
MAGQNPETGTDQTLTAKSREQEGADYRRGIEAGEVEGKRVAGPDRAWVFRCRSRGKAPEFSLVECESAKSENRPVHNSLLRVQRENTPG